MRLALAPILTGLAVVGACRTRGPVGDTVRGPLPTRNQHPLALTELAFRSRRPIAQAPGTTGLALQAAYSSMFSSNDDDSAGFAFDGETARAVLRVRQGLGAGLDLEAELSASYTGGGFLDAFVQDFHELFNLPDPGREHAVDNGHDMVIRSEGEAIWSQPEGLLGVGDLPLVLTWSGGAEGAGAAEAWRYGARAGVELPTGSEEQGLGNGGVDWGAGLMAERSHGRWSHHLAAWWARVAQPVGLAAADVALEDAWQLEYALELRAFAGVSWLAQLQLRAPLVRDIDLEGIRDPLLDLGLGLVSDVGPRLRWFAAFHEDLLSRAGPDFGLSAGLLWGL